MESTHCFMLLHHIHSELLLVHSLQVALMAHGVLHCLALWLAEGHFQQVMFQPMRGMSLTAWVIQGGVKPPSGGATSHELHQDKSSEQKFNVLQWLMRGKVTEFTFTKSLVELDLF